MAMQLPMSKSIEGVTTYALQPMVGRLRAAPSPGALSSIGVGLQDRTSVKNEAIP